MQHTRNERHPPRGYETLRAEIFPGRHQCDGCLNPRSSFTGASERKKAPFDALAEQDRDRRRNGRLRSGVLTALLGFPNTYDRHRGVRSFVRAIYGERGPPVSRSQTIALLHANSGLTLCQRGASPFCWARKKMPHLDTSARSGSCQSSCRAQVTPS